PNAENLKLALDWLAQITDRSLTVHFGKAGSFEPKPLSYCDDESWLPRFIHSRNPTAHEFAVLVLALAPHLAPGFLDKLIAARLPDGGEFPEFGGVKGVNYRGIIPTGETAQFVIAGDDLEKRLAVQRILSSDHWFAQKHILWVEPVRDGEPTMSGRLLVDPELVEQVTVGRMSRPRFSVEFPAEYI